MIHKNLRAWNGKKYFSACEEARTRAVVCNINYGDDISKSIFEFRGKEKWKYCTAPTRAHRWRLLLRRFTEHVVLRYSFPFYIVSVPSSSEKLRIYILFPNRPPERKLSLESCAGSNYPKFNYHRPYVQ